jgi:hypothetical protein
MRDDGGGAIFPEDGGASETEDVDDDASLHAVNTTAEHPAAKPRTPSQRSVRRFEEGSRGAGAADGITGSAANIGWVGGSRTDGTSGAPLGAPADEGAPLCGGWTAGC